MSLVFADTFYWIALTNVRDRANRRVLEFSRSLGSRSIITTDEVLTELLNFCSGDVRVRMETALVLTNDHHFEQEGFQALFRDPE